MQFRILTLATCLAAIPCAAMAQEYTGAWEDKPFYNSCFAVIGGRQVNMAPLCPGSDVTYPPPLPSPLPILESQSTTIDGVLTEAISYPEPQPTRVNKDPDLLPILEPQPALVMNDALETLPNPERQSTSVVSDISSELPVLAPQ